MYVFKYACEPLCDCIHIFTCTSAAPPAILKGEAGARPRKEKEGKAVAEVRQARRPSSASLGVATPERTKACSGDTYSRAASMASFDIN